MSESVKPKAPGEAVPESSAPCSSGVEGAERGVVEPHAPGVSDAGMTDLGPGAERASLRTPEGLGPLDATPVSLAATLTHCPACAAATAGVSICAGCGLLLGGTPEGPIAPGVALDWVAEHDLPRLTVRLSLAAPPGSWRGLVAEAEPAVLDEGTEEDLSVEHTMTGDRVRYEVFVVPASDPAGALAARRAARQALCARWPDRVALPALITDHDACSWEITPIADLPSVTDGIGEIVARRRQDDALTVVERWLLPVCEFVSGLHAAGWFSGGLDPSDLLIDRRRVQLRGVPILWPIAGGAAAPAMRRAVRGFSGPEVHGAVGGGLSPASDVFFLGALLHAILARIAPLAEAADPLERLPLPMTWHADVPPELAAVCRRAVSPVPARRYPDAVAFQTALERAIEIVQLRRAAPPRRLRIDIGHELHVGVLKGQFSPRNQDDLFVAFHGPSGVGLFLVSDGVSISEYGSGDLASACVREAAAQTWDALVEGRHDGLEVEDETIDGLDDGEPVVPATAEARAQLLRNMLDAANRRIGELVHQQLPRFIGPPEGIMAATAVVALLDGRRMTVASIGDSRVYLIRDGHIIPLFIEHNLAHQLMRMNRSPALARTAPAAGALVRCVGEFRKGPEDKLVPVKLQPDVLEFDVLPGDSFVLCSDGVPDYGGLDAEDADERIRRAVVEAPGAPWAAFELMVLANRFGGGDNVSCVVLRFEDGDAEREGRR